MELYTVFDLANVKRYVNPTQVVQIHEVKGYMDSYTEVSLSSGETICVKDDPKSFARRVGISICGDY